MNLQISHYQKNHKEKWLKLLIKNEEDDPLSMPWNNVLQDWMWYSEQNCDK